MKANRRLVYGEAAVSPVIAVILMVAITVVLAATVYLFVSGFGGHGEAFAQASFAAKAVDLPRGDPDNAEDAIEITYVGGDLDAAASDIELYIDGASLVWLAASDVFAQGGAYDSGDLCASSPGGATNDIWRRGSSVYLVDTDAATGTVTECDGTPTLTGGVPLDLAGLAGVHQVKVVVRNIVVLDTMVEVRDDVAS